MSNPSGASRAASRDLHELALDKLQGILGERMAVRVAARALAELGIRRLETADDLYQFGQSIVKQGGFEGATGSMLVLVAVIEGASGQPPLQPPTSGRDANASLR